MCIRRVFASKEVRYVEAEENLLSYTAKLNIEFQTWFGRVSPVLSPRQHRGPADWVKQLFGKPPVNLGLLTIPRRNHLIGVSKTFKIHFAILPQPSVFKTRIIIRPPHTFP